VYFSSPVSFEDDVTVEAVSQCSVTSQYFGVTSTNTIKKWNLRVPKIQINYRKK
jgi:hypothetical protein